MSPDNGSVDELMPTVEGGCLMAVLTTAYACAHDQSLARLFIISCSTKHSNVVLSIPFHKSYALL